MLDVDARIAAVNGRAARLRRRKERRITVALSGACTALFLGLLGVIGQASGQSSFVSVAGLYGSSSLLGSDAGGYVLVAVVSFALAVAVTMLCLRHGRSGRNTLASGASAPDQAADRSCAQCGDERSGRRDAGGRSGRRNDGEPSDWRGGDDQSNWRDGSER